MMTEKMSEKKPCTCVEDAGPLLAERNTRLILTFFFGPSAARAPMPTIATERIENRRDGKRAVVVIPSFCPFCGVEYPKETKEEG